MTIGALLGRWKAYPEREAIVWKRQSATFGCLLERTVFWQKQIAQSRVISGSVVLVEADFSPDAVALFLALADARCVIVPVSGIARSRVSEIGSIAQSEFVIKLDNTQEPAFAPTHQRATHEFYLRLRDLGHPGLVLFSSGSSGPSKGVVHDFTGLLAKFSVEKAPVRAIGFLLFDHIGGINTMLHILANGGCLITIQDRSPDGVLATVEKHKVELLPTSPTFINLILLSEAYSRHQLSSLQVVSYGTEPMQENVLRKFHELLPNVKLLQTYGLSEVGILRSQSKSSDSLWVRLGGDGFETRVRDGVLQLKAQSAMLGYLNAPSPFSSDGWFDTGDLVEVDGEYFRFLGRKSEVINVGGEKVFPTEVEDVVQQAPNVKAVSVYGERNPITGQIVCAKVILRVPEDPKDFIRRLKFYCRERLPPFKVPVRITVLEGDLHTSRFKMSRFSGQSPIVD
jgi:long-chain acyl-CoA synthetase